MHISFDVGIVVTRRKLNGPWASHAWLPYAVLPTAPSVAPGTRLGADAADETYYAGPFQMTLYPSDTSHYRDNLSSGRPSLWVSLRLVNIDDYEISAVTADPYEGESLAGDAAETVEALPMPTEIEARIRAYFEAFHVERVFFKRDRAAADGEGGKKRNRGKDRS
jgi:Protein of unknown function (DUF3305)